MPVSIRFLGTAAFEILTADDKRILTDPYLDENSKSPYNVRDLDYLDLLLVTHAAYDHLGTRSSFSAVSRTCLSFAERMCAATRCIGG